MPTSSGQLQLQDYDAALVARGFDGFRQSERYQMINLGYRAVARKFPMGWQAAAGNYTIAPGTAILDTIGGGTPLSPKNVKTVIITTDLYRNKLEPEEEHRFLERWLMLDLTASANRGTPAKYFVWENALYVLPPPQTQMTFKVFYNQWLPDMVDVHDSAALPMGFDEVILDAALVRCHRRAHELQLAGEAQIRVDLGIEELLALDVFQSEELQERVLPDDQWF